MILAVLLPAAVRRWERSRRLRRLQRRRELRREAEAQVAFVRRIAAEECREHITLLHVRDAHLLEVQNNELRTSVKVVLGLLERLTADREADHAAVVALLEQCK